MKEQIEKQAIEEMAKVIKSSLDGLGIGNFNFTGDEISTMFAKALYNAGYRKQSDGEWIEHGEIGAMNTAWECSVCHWKTVSFTEMKHSKFCPNCGAKMKGGE